MDVRIKTKGHVMTPATSRYLENRLRSLEKLLGGEADTARCEVEIGRGSGKRSSDYMWYVEIHIIASGKGKKSAYATNNAPTVNAAIDDAKEEVERQIRKIKLVRNDAVRKGGALAKKRMRGD